MSPRLPACKARCAVRLVALYGRVAIIVSSVLFMAGIGLEAGASGVMAVVASTLAIVWNVTFNHLFERWEARQTVRRLVGNPARCAAALLCMPWASRAGPGADADSADGLVGRGQPGSARATGGWRPGCLLLWR